MLAKKHQAVLTAGLFAVVAAIAAPTSAQVKTKEDTSDKAPRFVSLKPSRANLRSGPGTEYPTVWVYNREGLPLEVLKEFEGWRQVRDADGASGWILNSFLSGRRTALIAPWDGKATPPPQIAVYGDRDAKSHVVAKVEAGVIASVISCDAAWCWIAFDQFKGYVEQKMLWGVYPKEVVK